MVSEINISGISFFMPVITFLFIFILVYAILAKTKILGESKWVNLLIGFIVGIIFMSFSSINNGGTTQYVNTIVPWAVVLLVCIFLILVLAGLGTKDLGKIMTSKFAWVIIIILIVIFLISAIKVFNPVFHPDYGITSGDKPQVLSQIWDFFGKSTIGGSILLILIGIVVAIILTRKWA